MQRLTSKHLHLLMALFLMLGIFFPVFEAQASTTGPAISPAAISAAPASSSPANLPVLLVYNDSYTSNKFGRFLGEIMKAEGFNLFDTDQLANITSAQLANYDTVVLAETTLTAPQASLFTQYVQNGGNLIAMRPDSQLSSVFGFGTKSGTLSNAYVAIQTNNSYGQGFPTDSLQTHTTADQYSNYSSQPVASLYSNATTSTSYPAVLVNNYGSGKAAAFSYDLASAVVYLRQGNPNQTNTDADGDGVVRSVDMFYNWIDLTKMYLPQADLHQRFFGKILSQFNLSKRPLPRIWYFPNAKNTAAILTSDAHGNPDSYFQTLITSMKNYGVSTTFYMAQAGQPAASNVTTWQGQGFVFSTHPYMVDNPLSTGYDNVDSWFDTTYGTRTSQTVRIHRVQWQGWADAAKIGAQHGYLLDYSFYRYGSWLKTPDGSWARGYLTGSGMPMKIIDEAGQVVNYYGQYTEIADDQILQGPEQLDQGTAYQVTKNAIDSSEAGNNQPVTFQMHVDYYSGEQTWAENTLGYLNSQAIPVFNGDSWLNFTNNRYNSTVSNVAWANNQLTFSNNIPAGQSGQTIAIPAVSATGNLSGITVNGTTTSYTTRAVRGENLALVVLPAGSSTVVATFTPDTTPPAVSNVQVLPGTTSAVINWTTSEAATSKVNYGTTQSLGSSASTSDFATGHSITLSGLTNNTSYYYQIVSADQFGNTTSTTPATFSTVYGQLIQNSYSQFGAGSGNNTAVTAYNSGEIKLLSSLEDTFAGTTLDSAKWSSGAWVSGGGNTVSGGTLNLGGGYLTSVASTPVNGLNLEASLKFTAGAANQHFGPSPDLGSSWFIFSVPNFDPSSLYARTYYGGTQINEKLGTVTLGVYHNFQIRISSTQVVYLVDGVALATHTISNVNGSMPVWLSSASTTGPIAADWVRVNNYPASGTFTSSAIDAGATSGWSLLEWSGALNGGNVQFEARSSFDAANWTAWTAPASGASIGLNLLPGRYIQYRVTLTTASSTASPLVSNVTINYNPATVGPAPAVSSVSPNSGSTYINRTVQINGSNFVSGITAKLGNTALSNLTFVNNNQLTAVIPSGITPGTYSLSVINPDNQPATLANAYTVTATPPPSLSLASPDAISNKSANVVTISGANFVAPVAVSLNSTPISGATLVNSSTISITVPTGFTTGTYDITVTNADGQTGTLSNALIVLPPAIIQTTQTDFAAGTKTGTTVTSRLGGEVKLSSSLEDSFGSPTLDPNLWASDVWSSGGSTTISNGTLVINAAYARSANAIPITRLQGRIKFSSGSPYQHFGFSPDLNSSWLLFSTPGFDASKIYARTNYNGVYSDTPLNVTLDTYHDFLITVSGNTVSYYVDGTLATSANVTVTGSTYVWLSAGSATANFSADSVIAGNYPASGGFTSSVLDAGQLAIWNQLYWTYSANGGSASVQARTSTDGTTWSSWSTASSTAGTVNLSLTPGRYFQYQLNLTTGDPASSPEVTTVAGIYGSYNPGALASIVVSPASPNVGAGGTQQFTAQGFDSNGVVLLGLTFTWSTTGGGTINGSGLYTAGATPGSYPNSVVATSGSITGATSVTVIAPAPTVSAISPATGSNTMNTSVTISGSNFATGATVKLGTTSLTSVVVVSGSQITAVAPSGIATGVYPVTVTNADGQSATLNNAYTVISYQPPSLSYVNPEAVSNKAANTLTINGDNFLGPVSVSLNSTSLTGATVVNSNTISVSIPSGFTPGTYSVTVTNLDGQSATLSNVLTVLSTAAINTSQADFAAGTKTNTWVTNRLGGEVKLTAAIEDYFNSATLDTNLWTSDIWSSGGSATISNGALVLNAAYARSVNPQPITRLQGRLKFTSGSANQHFGFSPDLGSSWLLFSTPGFDASKVYARTNYNGVYSDTPLNVTLDTYHDFVITVSGNTVSYYVDGTLATSANVTVTGSTYIWLSAGSTTANFSTKGVSAGNYPASGTFTSAVLDAGQSVNWAQLYWSYAANGGSATVQARTSTDGTTWTAWSAASSTAGTVNLSLPLGRYFQYQLDLATSDPGASPEVAAVAGVYAVPGPLATIVVSPATTSLQTGTTQQFTAQGYDSNNLALPGLTYIWSTTGGGTINSSGLYTAGSTPGSYPNSVVATSGSITGKASVTVTAPPPTLASITPATGGTLVTNNVIINGSNFQAGASVKLGTTSLTGVTVVNATQITAVVPAGMAAGAYTLTVTNPDNQSANLANAFTAVILAPTVSTVTPNIGDNSIDRTITINGANINSAATVQLGTTTLASVTYVSQAQITAVVPKNFAAGTYSVTVNNPDGQNATLANAYTVIVVPTITSIAPATGGTLVTTNVTITGTNYKAGATVKLGTTSLTGVTVVNATQITAVVPVGMAAGTYTLTVTNPDNQTGSLANAFTVQVLAPTVSGVTPTSRDNLLDRTITINGASINSAATVQLGTTTLGSVTYVSQAQITAVVPKNFTPGTYPITVRNPDGQTGTLANAYTVTAAPVLNPAMSTVCTTAAQTSTSCLASGTATAAGLLPTFQDGFTGTTLNTSLWTFTRYATNGSNTITNGTIMVRNSYISSNTSYTQSSLEGRVSFSSAVGANQNFGWGTSNFPFGIGPWAMFGIPSTDPTAVYARTNNGLITQQTKIATVSLDTFYVFRIMVGTSNIRYYVDNTLVATHNLTTTSALRAYLSSSNNNSNNLQAEWIQVNSYPTSGTFTTATIDAGAQVTAWGTINWTVALPAGTTLSVQTQTSVNGTTWSALSTAVTTSGSSITSPVGRYIRYRLTFTSSTDRAWTPTVTAVSMSYTLQ